MISFWNRIKGTRTKAILISWVAFSCLLLSTLSHAETVKIGVRTVNGIENAINKWQETANYLTSSIKNTTFELVPVTGIGDLADRTGRNEFDFILTNPSSYVEIEQKHNASRLVTLQNKRQGKPYTVFGSVIFTRKDRDDINTIQDLEDKTLMVISEKAFGGWQVARGEMLDNDFTPHKKLKKLIYSSQNTQFDVVNSVLNHTADAGVVRTDMLERMEARNKIHITDIKVLGQKKTKGFPFLHSTKLYPEWAFVKAHHTSNELAQKVAIALLNLNVDHPAAISGQYVGWNVPLNYEPVNELLRQLRVEPYENYGKLELSEAFSVYRIEFEAIAALFLLALTVLLYFYRTNCILSRKKIDIENKNNELEIEISQRNNNITLLNTIGNAQSSYINTSNEKIAFDSLLTGILELTGSHFGSIIQVKEYTNAQHRYTSYSTLTRYYNDNGLLVTDSIPIDFANVTPIFEVLERVTQQQLPIISTISLSDSDILSKKIISNMPCSENFLAAPIMLNKQLLGTIFLWNSVKEFDNELLELFTPLLSTCTNLITRFNEKKLASENEHALRESEKQQRTILDTISDALIVINEDGKIGKFNPAAEQMFGYTNDEVIGKLINILMPEDLSDKHNYYIKKRLEGDKSIENAVIAEVIGKRKDGSEFPALLSVSEMTINHRRYFTSFMRDITDTKKAEELKRDRDTAELANKAKSDFLANMSHEFRTPMHGIMSFSKLGLKKLEKHEYSSLKKYFENIETSGQRLIKLINNILDLSSIESGQMSLELENCNLEIIIYNCINEIESLIENKSLTITIEKDEGEFDLSCDRTKIHQTVTNLLSNAIKFSPENDTILIRIQHELMLQDNQKIKALRLSVLDNGIGIPKGEEKSVFNKFAQSSITKNNAGGTGLGLSICKEFIKLHHGDITASNQPEGGTCFGFILPIQPQITDAT
ncbi:MAG: PhnD/SsuA/transferrin family substrate-binding protein [Gammaproteobacteria bacterium]|nr:PhnD/SsuA/transferrin family substrate-binding protein [Gammaproteobacteria bacterium]